MKKSLLAFVAATAATATAAQPAPLQALPGLEIAPYMGTWYQALWIPNRFQRQCVGKTAATYRDLGNGTVEVLNRCRTADGKTDSVTGIARPPSGVSRIEAGAAGGQLPAVVAALDRCRLGRLLGGGSRA